MKKKIDIEYTTIIVPKRINVDGEDYPITQHNVDVVRKYQNEDDEKVLDNLTSFVISF